MKKIIINADDFGYSKVFNITILDLLQKQQISSTTAMVDRIHEDQNEQVKSLVNIRWAKNMDVWLHLEFGNQDFDKEIERQFDKFVDIFGFKPDHIDIHKPSCSNKELSALQKFCTQNKIPGRNQWKHTEWMITTDIACFNGSKMTLDEIKNMLNDTNDNQSLEILFHPWKYDPNSKSTFNKDRRIDTQKIIQLYSYIDWQDIKLINFKQLNQF